MSIESRASGASRGSKLSRVLRAGALAAAMVTPGEAGEYGEVQEEPPEIQQGIQDRAEMTRMSVVELIKYMDSDEFILREWATDILGERGEEVYDELKNTLETLSHEQRWRVKKVIDEVDHQRMVYMFENGSTYSPSDEELKTGKDALLNLIRQTNNTTVDITTMPPSVLSRELPEDFSFTPNKTFWFNFRKLQKVCPDLHVNEVSGGTLKAQSEEDVEKYQEENRIHSISTSGPFRAEIFSMQGQSANSTKIELQPEGAFDVEDFEFVSANLKRFGGEWEERTPIGKKYGVNFYLPSVHKGQPNTAIFEVTYKITAFRIKRIAVPNVEKDATQYVNGCKIFYAATKNEKNENGLYSVKADLFMPCDLPGRPMIDFGCIAHDAGDLKEASIRDDYDASGFYSIKEFQYEKKPSKVELLMRDEFYAMETQRTFRFDVTLPYGK